MKNYIILFLYLFLYLCISTSSASAQPMFLLRGSEKFPVRDLPDSGRSVVIDGKTFFLVAKEDLAALSAESELSRARETKNDTLIVRHEALLARYAIYQAAADSLVTKQEQQVRQSELINKSYDDLYQQLKRLTGISPWSIAAGIGVQSFDANTRLMGSVGLGYQHWIAQYQFAKNFDGVLVGFRLAL